MPRAPLSDYRFHVTLMLIFFHRFQAAASATPLMLRRYFQR
jgi:hypothetical protein